MKLLHKCKTCGCEIYLDNGKLVVKTRGFIICALCYQKIRQLQKSSS